MHFRQVQDALRSFFYKCAGTIWLFPRRRALSLSYQHMLAAHNSEKDGKHFSHSLIIQIY